MIELLHIDCMEYMSVLPDKAGLARFEQHKAQGGLFAPDAVSAQQEGLFA